MARVFAASIEMAGEMTDARPPFRDFDVFSDLSGESVLITVQGDVGRSNVREIAAALDEAMFFRQSAVVLDLAHMNSMDFGGVDVIASAASRLAGVGGQLTLRSPSAKVVKVFEIAGLTDRVLWDPPIAFERRQGLEESMQVAPVRVDTDNTGLLYGIREMTKVTAVPANLDVVEAALRIVTTLAQAAVVGADGVSISLRRHGQLATVAASDQTISDMDFDQYSTGEGPCIDASVKGHRLYSEYLDDEPRWPLFTPKAKSLGINAILSTPLLAQQQPVGSLNMYSRTRSAFMGRDQELAAKFGTEISTILTVAGVGISDERQAALVQQALKTRELITLAQGVLMERDGVNQDEAFSILRRVSQADNRPIYERAEDIVSSTSWPKPIRKSI